jgi:hypothetical protein
VRGRGGAPGAGWVLPLLLLLPPAAHFFWDFEKSRTRRAEGVAASGPQEPPPAVQTASLRQLLWEKERELKLLRGWSQSQPRYVGLRAEVVHLADLSPRRSGFWIWAEGFQGATTRSAVVYRETLVGRVERIWADRGVAQVQTLRDQYFRVRFRYGEAKGFLFGTGRVDGSGRPLLEIRHLGVETGFREGERVFTDGDDGWFPAGLPIGTLVRSSPEGAEGRGFEVRGEFPVEGLPEVVLLVDRAASGVRAILGKEDAE